MKLFGSLYVMGNEYGKQIYGHGMMIYAWSLSAYVDLKLMFMRMKLKYDKHWVNINNMNIMLFIFVILDSRCK